MKLKNRTVIITGGSRGIGKSIAGEYLKEGANVVIASRGEEELGNTVKEFQSIARNRFLGVQTDVSVKEDVQELINKTEHEFGCVDILVNAAGILSPVGSLLDVDEEDWVYCIRVHLIGTMYCCKFALPGMISKGKGKIINFFGGGASKPIGQVSAYTSAKYSVARFTESLAEELRPHKINVNCIAPGPVDTKLFQTGLEGLKRDGEKNYQELMKIKDPKPPESSNGLALYLATDESENITGKMISPIWDDWKNLNETLSKTDDPSLFTLRRVDEMIYAKIR
jgi:NAD(P)-dependent dehydrogenase (short-subunit alcohol dehydrogenase family)